MSVTTHSSTSYRPSRQIRRIKGLHRLLHHRLSVPLGMTESVLRQLKHAWNPSQARRRSALAAELERSDQDTFLEQYGYLRLEPYSLPGMREALDYCSAEYDKARAAGSALEKQSASVKEFLVSVIKDEELLDHPELFSFVISPAIVELAAKYFGAVPVLSGVRLWWTPPNDMATASQLFHCDREDQKQFKLLINVFDTTPETGPFTFIPADISAKLKKKINYSYKNYRLPDEHIAAAGGLDMTIPLIGPSGAAACVDTSRCLHYGSRGNTRDRLVLMVQYTDCLAPNVTVPDWHAQLSHMDVELSEAQQLALCVSQTTD